MARRFCNKLAAKQVMAITRPGKHSDGNGLYLLVKANGNRSWVLILIGNGQRREMGLGSPETVSLAEARRLAAEAKAVFDAGRDPIAERAQARPRRAAPLDVTLPGPKRRTRRHGGITFWEFAEKPIDEIEEGFRNDKHRKPWRATLDARGEAACPTVDRRDENDPSVSRFSRAFEPRSASNPSPIHKWVLREGISVSPI